MADSLPSRIQVFDPRQEFSVFERRLPHWSQAGTISFLTWRTWDSIPERVLEARLVERDAWLARHGIDVTRGRTKTIRKSKSPPTAIRSFLPSRLELLPKSAQLEFRRFASERWNEHLDACHGDCVLRRSELSKIVADSLLHFDGDRYDLTDFVIMPNHVHVLVAFSDEATMLRQCDSWKHYTATKLNQALSRKGRFWQQDGFDHLVRSIEQFEYLRRYIAENPDRANLKPGEYCHYSKQLS